MAGQKEEQSGKKKSKLTSQEYKFCCELIWGHVPDRAWGEESKLFQSEAPKILEKYPLLDKSLHGTK